MPNHKAAASGVSICEELSADGDVIRTTPAMFALGQHEVALSFTRVIREQSVHARQYKPTPGYVRTYLATEYRKYTATFHASTSAGATGGSPSRASLAQSAQAAGRRRLTLRASVG